MLSTAAVSGWRPAYSLSAATPPTMMLTWHSGHVASARSDVIGASDGSHPRAPEDHDLARLGRNARQVQRIIGGAGHVLRDSHILAVGLLVEQPHVGLGNRDRRRSAARPVDRQSTRLNS